MRVFCVLLPGGGGPPARRPFGAPARRPRCGPLARRLRSLCSLACLRVDAWGRRPARSPSALRASLGASSRSPRCELPACRPPRCELPACRPPRCELPACRPPRCELTARRPWSLCSLACLRVGAWGRRPARSPSAPRASLGASLVVRPGPAAAPRHQSQHRCMASLLVPVWGRIVRRGEPATEQGAPTRHGLVTGSDAPRAVFAVSA